jgi:Flp pilus assembly protein TadG
MKPAKYGKFLILQTGAATVEFAVIAILLLTLIFGAIDYGLLLYNKQVITNAAREGARSGIVQRSPGNRVTVAEIQNTVLSYCQAHLVTGASNPSSALEAPIVYYEDKNGTSVSDPNDPTAPNLSQGIIGVEVRYTYDFFVISYLGIGPKLLKAEIKMTME